MEAAMVSTVRPLIFAYSTFPTSSTSPRQWIRHTRADPPLAMKVGRVGGMNDRRHCPRARPGFVPSFP